MFVELSEEKRGISQRLFPICNQIWEIEELEQVREFRKAQPCPVSHLKPGLLKQKHDLELRSSHINNFILLVRHPERFYELSRPMIHRLLLKVDLSDEDAPISKGPAAIKAFVDKVLAPVQEEPDDEPWSVEEPAVASPAQSGWAASPAQSGWSASPEHSHLGDNDHWSPSLVPSEPDTECASCFDLFFHSEMISGKCSHSYCRECAVHMLQDAFKEESRFPPRCCHKDLPLQPNRSMFSDELWDQYLEKVIEHNDENRTYCNDGKCSKYILPTDVQNMDGKCRACNKQTCTMCKKAAHLGWCANDRDENLEELAKESGWQRCSFCGYLVELKSGCNHMT